MDAAGKFQARRRHKLATNLELEIESSENIPYEPSSSIFSDDSFYEGGVHESIRRKMSANKQKIRRAKTQMISQKKDTKKQSLESQQLVVKGSYPRVKTRKAVIKEHIEKNKNLHIFNKAVDMFMEDKNVYFQYKDFDEAMAPEVNDETPDLYEYEGINYKIDDYWPDRPSIFSAPHSFDYSPIPQYEGMNYIPPPFREKYEI